MLGKGINHRGICCRHDIITVQKTHWDKILYLSAGHQRKTQAAEAAKERTQYLPVRWRERKTNQVAAILKTALIFYIFYISSSCEQFIFKCAMETAHASFHAFVHQCEVTFCELTTLTLLTGSTLVTQLDDILPFVLKSGQQW